MSKFEIWVDKLVKVLSQRAEYHLYQSTDIEIDRGKFEYFAKEEIIKAIRIYRTGKEKG